MDHDAIFSSGHIWLHDYVDMNLLLGSVFGKQTWGTFLGTKWEVLSRTTSNGTKVIFAGEICMEGEGKCNDDLCGMMMLYTEEIETIQTS